MTILDAALLAALLGFGLRNLPALLPFRRTLLFAVLGLAVLQIAWEGYYWQFLPAYLVFALSAWGLSGRLWMALFSVPVLSAWLIVPVPQLTKPAGGYAVGTEVLRWTQPTDARKVVVQAWYPADPAAAGPRQAFIDGLGRLPESVGFLPRFLFRQYHQIDTFAVRSGQVSSATARWPVVIFLPGFGAPRAFYTSLVGNLASYGIVVLAVDHPEESPVTELADGTISVAREMSPNSEVGRVGFMAIRMEARAADASFVIDQLGLPGRLGPQLSGRLAQDQVAVIGHSLGGASAAVAMHRDGRVKGGGNIDGTMHGSISQNQFHHPFLVIESDRQVTRHSQQYVESTKRLLENLTDRGHRYEIKRTNHYAFTDLPLLFSGPGRFLVSQILGGSRPAEESHRITVDLVVAFLRELNGGPPDLVQQAASRYSDVVGGPTR